MSKDFDSAQTIDFLANATYVAFDTETTGLMAFVNQVVELGAVKFRLDSDSSEEFQSLINPGRSIPDEVIRIHGITDEMVADAPSVKQVLIDFIEFCGPDTILIAHNAPFDISFLFHELKRSKLLFGDNPVIDTLDIYRRFFPGLPSYSLLAIAQKYKIVESQNHRAFDDADIVRQLFIRAMPKLPAIGSVADIADFCSVLKIDSFQQEDGQLPEKFADISLAIKHSKRLEIDYAKAGQLAIKRVIRPELVHQQNNVLYIIGFCELVQAGRTFRLDRIESFHLLD